MGFIVAIASSLVADKASLPMQIMSDFQGESKGGVRMSKAKHQCWSLDGNNKMSVDTAMSYDSARKTVS